MSDPRISEIADTYRTTDFKIAAFLKAKRVEHVTSERDPAGRVTFVFADTVRCDELVGEIYCGSVYVSMPDYWAAEHSLRTTINQGAAKRDHRNE